MLKTYHDVDTIKVSTSTLDSLSSKSISFVKIDVEGHEMEVLSGGQKLIAQQKPVFMVEAEERHSTDALEKIKDFFEKFHYQGFYISGKELFPFDSFVAELQNPSELERSVPRKEMSYINNFIFLPPSLDTASVIRKIIARLGSQNWIQIFVLLRVAMSKSCLLYTSPSPRDS